MPLCKRVLKGSDLPMPKSEASFAGSCLLAID